MFESVGFLGLIHLDRLINYSYSFGKQPATRVFKNKNLFPRSGKRRPSHQQVYLKRTWPIRQFLRPKKRCRSSHSQMFFKIDVLKNVAIFTGKDLCWSLLLIELQAFRCFWILQNCYKQLFYRTPPVTASADVLFYIIQKDVVEYIVVLQCIIVSFWNLKLLSFAFIRCNTRCHSLSLDVPLACLFINDHLKRLPYFGRNRLTLGEFRNLSPPLYRGSPTVCNHLIMANQLLICSLPKCATDSSPELKPTNSKLHRTDLDLSIHG